MGLGSEIKYECCLSNRMDTLPCLQQQNKSADTGRYGTEKLSPLLPEVQAGTLIEVKNLRVTVIKEPDALDAEPMICEKLRKLLKRLLTLTQCHSL